MFRAYVERGLLAGAAGGLTFGLFVALVGNPLVHAIEEMGHDHSHGAGGHEASVVSEATTSVASIGGGVLWGLLLGTVVFGLGYYVLEPAIPGTGATKRYVLAAAGFVTVSGAPWLVSPPNRRASSPRCRLSPANCSTAGWSSQARSPVCSRATPTTGSPAVSDGELLVPSR